MARLFLVTLVLQGCVMTSHSITAVAPHKGQLVIVATRTTTVPGVGSGAVQTVNACGLQTDRLRCKLLNVEFDATPEPIGITYADDAEGRAVLKAVSAEGPCGRAGMAAGDVVVAIDGRSIVDARSLKAAIDAAGFSIEFTVMRDGLAQRITVER